LKKLSCFYTHLENLLCYDVVSPQVAQNLGGGRSVDESLYILNHGKELGRLRRDSGQLKARRLCFHRGVFNFIF